MPWTTPRTWTTGEIPTAANFNSNVRDNLNTLGPTIVGYVTSAGSVGSGTGFTVTGGGGDYTVTFTTAYSNIPVVVAVPDNYAIFWVTAVSATGFQAHGRNTSAGAQAVGFSFHVAPLH